MRRFLLTLLTATCIATPALAEEFTREQIEQIVQEYIAKNPKTIIDSVNNYGKAQQEEEDKKASDLVIKNRDWLLNNKNHAEAGNPKGDVTLVEFFDYNCGYCKQALTDIMTLVEEDKNLRVVFVEIPILGESSFEAARWALAAQEQKLYLEYHISLMRHKGGYDPLALADYAKKVGMDVEKLEKEKAKDKYREIMDDNIGMANTLGVSGTPAFVVGDQLMRGYVGIDALRDAIATARKAK